jgi:hypothetical protein
MYVCPRKDLVKGRKKENNHKERNRERNKVFAIKAGT